ncbi:hypothetical protein SNE40_017808 [Patella caerulea]|uniref:Uncharacterized protein n=1 Tax=Patella caerulea TaxID=87958 RepID=A0AAN8JB51_PATCE
MSSTDEKSANQFISVLVKNLQAVCHGHVDFDKNVKVVGHLYLTVDSNSEFNYIVNEKVSKSDESSTTFISKSFYATDPQQKTPKKNVDRPLPPPTPNVLGKTRYDISVDLTNEFASTDKRQSVPYAISQNQSLGPQKRRSQKSVQYPPLGKRSRLSPNEQKSVNFQFPRNISSRSSSTIPSTSVSIETINNAACRATTSPSATPIESLPGTDRAAETTDSVIGGMLDPKSIKIENRMTSEGEEKELKIESVTSHDLSFVSESEKDSESKNIETSDSYKPASDPPENLSTETTELITANRSSPKSNEHEVIEIDLTKVKEEFRDFEDSESNSMFDSSVNHGEASYSGVGIETNDDDEFFKRLQEQAVGIYPLGLHVNESNIQNSNLDISIPNLQSVSSRQTRNLSAGTSSFSAGSQPNALKDIVKNSSPIPKPRKRKLKILDLETKIQILKEVDEGQAPKSCIAARFGIPPNTLSTILKNRQKLINVYESNLFSLNRKKFRLAKHPKLEDALCEWVEYARKQNIYVSGALLLEKATNLAGELGIINFNPTSGWLSRFKQRRGIFLSV